MNDAQSRLREIPQVSALLEDQRLCALLAGRRRFWLLGVIQKELAGLRVRLPRETGAIRDRGQLLNEVVEAVEAEYDEMIAPAWTRVLNATGVVVHTNLGRSNLPAVAAEAVRAVAQGNSDLEFDLAAGSRGHRGRRVEAKAAVLTGAEDALVVNNNAAALWLAVRHLASGGRVIISRGEVVAIGGSFRIHEILAETGCELVEVGTTNRTTCDDYAAAMIPGAVLLKVHRSNFEMTGFIAETTLSELVALARETDGRVIYDAGSGALYPMADLGLPGGETELHQDVAVGCDLVTCSGDKLLGGCQAGIIMGSAATIAALRKHPMRRAFRVDKMTLAALDAVLGLYLEAEDLPAIPTLRMLAATTAELEERAGILLRELEPLAPAGWRGAVVPAEGSVGGGAFSSARIASRLVLWTAPKVELEKCHRLLRTGDPALVGRMGQDGLGVDLRTLSAEELPLVVTTFQRAWNLLTTGDQQLGGSETR
ncbi:L-seryl-tRNA(Sec) selenium transferase [bacterium]|nr:MAG: L-seryl-tRNA(Sec) selenium transferase [bacterium]